MQSQNRKVFIGGNWKCNLTLAQAKSLTQDVLNKAEVDTAKMEVAVFPIALQISQIQGWLENKNVQVSKALILYIKQCLLSFLICD